MSHVHVGLMESIRRGQRPADREVMNLIKVRACVHARMCVCQTDEISDGTSRLSPNLCFPRVPKPSANRINQPKTNANAFPLPVNLTGNRHNLYHKRVRAHTHTHAIRFQFK